MHKKSATHRLMDYLAIRDHSEQELVTKLKKFHSPEEIQQAINYGKDQGWIAQTEEQLQSLSEKVSRTLQRKGKGPVYINQYLHQRGLPKIKIDSEDNLENALKLLERKFRTEIKPENYRNKAALFLKSKGFDLETVRKAVSSHEKQFSNS